MGYIQQNTGYDSFRKTCQLRKVHGLFTGKVQRLLAIFPRMTLLNVTGFSVIQYLILSLPTGTATSENGIRSFRQELT